ncbi:MAG: Glyoxalase/bleomycin resistance protein/dioxygenase [Thermoleophilia bacterium]|nr:Glyoxalase/bleomycin resistance protein/dioxygenase [Thermoleophilia bacterium]
MTTSSQTTTQATTTQLLPRGTTLGVTRLVVTDLDRSVDWYRRVIGLAQVEREGGLARLAAQDGPVVVELEERPSARPAGRHAGLYHLALLYPTRLELSHQLRRIAASGAPVQGLSDHHTHEAIYLPDPDGNGLELAADRPKELWPPRDIDPFKLGIAPIDVDSLLAESELDADTPELANGVVTGHLHLHVGSIPEATIFWRDVVGFEPQTMVDVAGFVSVDGYHHQLGFNTWKGEGAAPVPDDVTGLAFWTLVLPDAVGVVELEQRLAAAGASHARLADGTLTLRDPWNMLLHVTVRD